MATITNLNSGIEIQYGGALTYIKHGNVKLLKRGGNLNIYDDSDDDGNQRGQVYISIPYSEVTSPSTADIDELYDTVRDYVNVSISSTIIGWQDFADTATTASPIEQTNVNGGEVQLTNNNSDTLTDGNTSVNAETTVSGLNDLWSTVSNTLVFKGTGIQKNDTIDLRVHLNINAKIIDQAFNVRIDFYDEEDGNGNLVFSLRRQIHVETLSAGVFREEMVNHDFFIGESILEGSAKIILEGTKSFEVEVIGWNIKILKIAR